MYKVKNLTNGQEFLVKPNYESHLHSQINSYWWLWCLNPVHVKPVCPCVFVEPFCPCQLPINFAAFDSSRIKMYLKWYHNFADFHFISPPQNWPNVHQNLQVLGGPERVAATIRKKFVLPDLSYPSKWQKYFQRGQYLDSLFIWNDPLLFPPILTCQIEQCYAPHPPPPSPPPHNW